MTRGDVYRVRHPERDPRRARAFVVVSRQLAIDSGYSTVVCAPIYSRRDGLSSQVNVGQAEGLKHESCVHCDGLVSLRKSDLTDYVGALSIARVADLDAALRVALALE